MQNVQNAAEIQQRVINLVELYRTKVGKESPVARQAKADFEYWEKESVDDEFGTWGEGPHTEAWTKQLMVNEQLLGHFYSVVAGNNAEDYVLVQLLPDVYDNSVFTEEEEAFLAAHFKEMVNYIVLTPCDDSLEWVHRHDGKDAFTIPSEVLDLIKSHVEIAAGSRVYYPKARFAQLANLFDGCTYIFDNTFYAWTKIALYANGIMAEDSKVPSSYDAIVSYIPDAHNDSKDIARLCDAYKDLPVNGKLVLLCPSSVLAGTGNARLRKILVEDNAVKEIIQLPQAMSNNASFDTYCLLVAEKGLSVHETSLIDTRTASYVLDTKHYMQSFSNDKFNAIMQNDGKDPNTGLRKVVKVQSDNLNQDILLPQVYTIERPAEAEKPVPLSDLCSLESTRVRDVRYDLPEDTPWIAMGDLSTLFSGGLDVSGVSKANCPNNPAFVKDNAVFDKDGDFVLVDRFYGLPEIADKVWAYRRCTFLDGKNDSVLFEAESREGTRMALVKASGKPIAVNSGIKVFSPKSGFDAMSLLALLRLPVVYRQIQAYQEFGLEKHLDDILVPTDKRVIGDELYRMEREKSVTDELGEKVQAMKTDYINEVRMRKHDMGQKVFDLINTEDLMRYYVENRETENDLWPQLEEQLDHLRHTIHELSEMLDHLSQEEHFGSPELINLDEYLRSMQHSNSVSGFALSYQLDKDGVAHALLTHENDKIIADEQNIRIHPTVWIAKNDIQRVVGNIISNAQKHGFIDSSRQDYEVKIVLSFNSEKCMYQIDFRNNGQPLPEGLNKMRYGIKGEKAGQTAGTGVGGSVVKAIVEHYKGDYDVFMDGEWTVVRIYLPKAI